MLARGFPRPYPRGVGLLSLRVRPLLCTGLARAIDVETRAVGALAHLEASGVDN